jgi:hypothetical protein
MPIALCLSLPAVPQGVFSAWPVAADVWACVDVMGTEMTAPAIAAIATFIIEPWKRLDMTISSFIKKKAGKWERNACTMLPHCLVHFPRRRYGTRKTDVGDFQCAPAVDISAADN